MQTNLKLSQNKQLGYEYYLIQILIDLFNCLEVGVSYSVVGCQWLEMHNA